ncbi:TetR/AcrR family transcriptional regulator [Bifidobacterium choloepi]|uniref:TetR/AcrR family transcriptional regulator n=1 Tax=Bifidobacterium choloepi TaxID=2614131 RepID=A0A6I5N4B0_9BIFI|nr:TetR/AcrR family transcriptional regulator [Bifidobacterium choloepi]NEG70519.1 TetR/AcrR family transcriptional regulator [Bifidobacterium choloepi]
MTLASWEPFLTATSPAADQVLNGTRPSGGDEPAKRKRMSTEERHLQILRTAAKIISVKGYWGLSLQDIADEIGISEAALYHYIDSKEDLLNLVLSENYDTTEATQFSALNASTLGPDGQRIYFFPRYCLNTLLYNVQRPEMAQLYCVLSGEALNPEHPAHQFFTARHIRNWELVGSINWLLPPSVDEDRLYDLYTLVTSAADGLQSRWLADDGINPVEEWLNFSDLIFPEDTWAGFRDPSEILNDSPVD